MSYTTLVVGSLEALGTALDDQLLGDLGGHADVVVLPTAAAFTGLAEAALAVAQILEGRDVRVEALMVGDRAAAYEPHFVERLAGADLVVLCGGSALHARTVWRATPVGEALRAVRRLVAVGSVATVLGEVMIDPRGGAPTTGLGYRPGLAICVGEGEEQLARTRSLLAPDETLVALGPLGVLARDDTAWHVIVDDLDVTRGHQTVVL